MAQIKAKYKVLHWLHIRKNHTDMRRIVLNISPNLVRNINIVIDDDINAYEIILRVNRKRMFRLRQSK